MNEISLKELKEKEPVWYFIDAVPSGKITTVEEYNYMIAYNNYFDFGFYWSDNDRHIPTFKECYNNYLTTIDFFGGAVFYFSIKKEGSKWSYGKYGKIKEVK